MNSPRKKPVTVDEYIASCPPDVRSILRRIRDTIQKAAPDAEERISYQMPTFFQDGVLVHYAAFKHHIGMYPPFRDDALKGQLAKYAGPKGNLQFPLDEPIPYALITKIVEARLKENRERANARKANTRRANATSSAAKSSTGKQAKASAKSTSRKSAKVSAKATSRTSAKVAKSSPSQPAAKKAPAKPVAGKPVLLSGGNPQIPKGYGDAPVQAYIAAMPGWKRDAGRRLDALITRTVPNVRKAVKWNSPFYGLEDDVWFLSFHCFTKYIKITFFRGASLQPVPPVASKHKEVRYFHLHEHDDIDETQFTAWIKQASKLPGERM